MATKPFGNLIPYGDPTWYQGWHSPYYNDSHVKLRATVRSFVDKEIMDNCHEWDEKKSLPKDLFIKFAKAGLMAAALGPACLKGKSKYIPYGLPNGVTLDNYDPFHELIVIDEVARCGSGGVLWGLMEGLIIGLPPVMLFGGEHLQDKVVKACLAGEKFICLAITEPGHGSDVANLQCSAVLSADKKHWIVNGTKKWITNGTFADYFTTAVRTGGKGAAGLSMMLIERGMKGVTTRQMICQGVWPSGTAFVTFQDVHVPVSNVIGKTGEGFKYIMYNFNHERWGIAVQAQRFARVCLEEAMNHAMRRETFGKKLIEHPVIRNKLAHMARHVEATQALLENITYQYLKMSKEETNVKLGGACALLKAQTTTTFELCAREASQIFGGLAYTRGGLGEKVERLYREVRAYAIPAGSEEIMLDLAAKQSLKTSEALKKQSKL